MTRQRVLAVLAATLALLGALNLLVYRLYRTERRTVARALDERLSALGKTAARWLSVPGGPADQGAVLAALVAENGLEDAYVFDGSRRVLAGVRTPADTQLNLLRLDDERVQAALAGQASVGHGYSVEQTDVDAGYFPLADGRILAVEAGAAFHAPLAQVRTTYLSAMGLSLLLVAIFSTGLGLALRALERARQAHGRAERLAAIGQMSAMVAHEVRNPLGILRGQVELARERLAAEAPARERERFVEMLAEIERLNRLTEEFLALARDAPVERAALDLRDLIAEVMGAARAFTTSAGARLDLQLPEAGLAVEGDALKLRQLLLNLVLNAAQVGGAGVHVRVAAAAVGDEAVVTVADDGPGVPAELVANLFEPFVGARPGGSGLGLAVARRIAERHGGRLVLDPAPAGAPGASFSLHLPLARVGPR
jgi:two-component system OmpR family sensor kinase